MVEWDMKGALILLEKEANKKNKCKSTNFH